MKLYDFAWVIALGLFLGMFVLLELGIRLGRRRIASRPDADVGITSIDAAVFGLLGLLIAFTFAGATSRFDIRRGLIVQEANDIGTAYLRLDLLPAEAQPALRESFRRYVDSRLAIYKALPDMAAAKAEMERSASLQRDIWTQAIAATRTQPMPAATLLLPALNQMFDITTTRTAMSRTHPPVLIFVVLISLGLTSALLAGIGMSAGKTRSWIHIAAFAAVMSLTVYVIIDLEFPRFGFLRVDDFDQLLVDVRENMRP